MPSKYLHAGTKNPRIFILHEEGEEPIEPTDKQLIAWREAILPIRMLFLARQRKTALDKHIDDLRKRIWKARGNSKVPGFIGHYGKHWLRVLFVVSEPRPLLVQAGSFVDHVGEQLPNVARSVTVELSAAEYLEFAEWHHEKYEQLAHLLVLDADVDNDAAERLALGGELKPFPEGMFQMSREERRLEVSVVEDPTAPVRRRKTIRRRR